MGGRGERGEWHQQEVPTEIHAAIFVKKRLNVDVTTFPFSMQVNIERDFNLKELKKAAEEKEKLKEKNAKKDKSKGD